MNWFTRLFGGGATSPPPEPTLRDNSNPRQQPQPAAPTVGTNASIPKEPEPSSALYPPTWDAVIGSSARRLRFTPDGSVLVAATGDGLLSAWRTTDWVKIAQTRVTTPASTTASVEVLAVTKSGTKVAVATALRDKDYYNPAIHYSNKNYERLGAQLQIFSLPELSLTETHSLATKDIQDVGWNAETDEPIVCARGDTIYLIRPGHDLLDLGKGYPASLSSCGRFIFLCQDYKSVRCHDSSSGLQLGEFRLPENLQQHGPLFVCDLETLAVCSQSDGPFFLSIPSMELRTSVGTWDLRYTGRSTPDGVFLGAYVLDYNRGRWIDVRTFFVHYWDEKQLVYKMPTSQGVSDAPFDCYLPEARLAKGEGPQGEATEIHVHSFLPTLEAPPGHWKKVLKNSVRLVPGMPFSKPGHIVT